MKGNVQLAKGYERLREWMLSHPREVIQQRHDFKHRLTKSRCVYGEGSVFNITLTPLFLRRESLDLLASASEAMDRILEKVMRLYVEGDPVIAEYFPRKPIPEAWIQASQRYSRITMHNRHDTLFDGTDLKFIELNTDNPGGKGWTDLYEDLFLDHGPVREYLPFERYQPDQRVLPALFDSVMDCHEALDSGAPPRVAFASFRYLGRSRGEEEIMRDYFISRGIEANLVDARDFEFDSGRVSAGGVRYTVVHRSLRAGFYTRFPQEMREFVQAVLDPRQTAMVNSFQAAVGSEKTLLSLFSNPLRRHYFSDEEAEILARHIPWTRRLDETITTSPEGEEISLHEYLLADRERLVIKPSDEAGGYGVVVGRNATPEKWGETVEHGIGQPDWVVQDYVEIPRIQVPVIRGHKVELETKWVNLSPYVFGGRYVGVLGRVSNEKVINVSAGGGIIPVFPLSEIGQEDPTPVLPSDEGRDSKRPRSGGA